MNPVHSIVRKNIIILKLAVRSLLLHKLRAALSILGVVCGVMAVLAMISIGEGAKKETINQIEQLGTKNIYIKSLRLTGEQETKAREKRSQGLRSYDAERILQGCSAVQNVALLKEIRAATIALNREVTPQIVTCSPNYAQVHKLSLGDGRFISEQDVLRKNQVCVLGESVAKDLGLHGRIGSYIRIENHLFKVIGILKRYDRKAGKSTVVSVRNFNEMIFLPISADSVLTQASAKESGVSTDELTELVIQMQKMDQVLDSVDIIKRIMEISHGGAEDYQIVVPQALLRQSKKTQRTFNIVLGSIAFISLLVGGIGIMNIMLATVSERTREIGIRRALGATREHIIMQFLAESVILTFTGGIVGIISGIGGVWVITSMAGWKTVINSWALIVPLFLSVLVGIFFGLYPAYNAARMDPIVALRHE